MSPFSAPFFNLHIRTGRAQRDHGCAEGRFGKDRRQGRSSRAPWIETNNTPKQDAKAEHHPCCLFRVTISVGVVCTRIAVNMRKRNSGVWKISVLGRRYVNDSHIRSYVEPVVWRAAVRKGIQLR